MINSKLDAINLCLRGLGEQPISSVDTQYPTLDLVEPALEEQRTGLLMQHWWFNTYPEYTILPDENSNIVPPADTLVFIPDNPEYLWSGDYVRKLDGSKIFTESVTGTRVVNLEFDELPQMVKYAVAYAAAAQVYLADVGADNIWQGLIQQAGGYLREMGAWHTRSRKANIRRKKNVAQWYAALRS